MKTQTTKLYNWATSKAESKRSSFWLFLLFFLEITLFLPLDAILMFFCLQSRKKIPLYIALATVASAASGLIGYLFGHFLWDIIHPYIVPYIISAASFAKTTLFFQAYENWAIFICAFTPFPIKVLTLSAGAFKLGVIPFLAYFTIARFLRFSLIGISMIFWGPQVKSFLDRHFHKVMLALAAKMAIISSIFWLLAK